MKKIIALTLALLMCVILLCGCDTEKPDDSKETTKSAETTTTEPEKVAFTGTAQEVLDMIVEKAKELDADQEYGIKSIECTDVFVDADSCTAVLGISTEDFNNKIEAAVESKPNGSWFTHSIVVVKVKDGVDVSGLANEIVKNTVPARFGCLKPESIVGGYAGQYIVFSASAATSTEAVYAALVALSGVTPVRIDRENDWSGGGMFFG